MYLPSTWSGARCFTSSSVRRKSPAKNNITERRLCTVLYKIVWLSEPTCSSHRCRAHSHSLPGTGTWSETTHSTKLLITRRQCVVWKGSHGRARAVSSWQKCHCEVNNLGKDEKLCQQKSAWPCLCVSDLLLLNGVQSHGNRLLHGEGFLEEKQEYSDNKLQGSRAYCTL